MEPPFYCVRMFIFVDATFGGITVTNDMQCLRDGEPIKGMYACGTESAMLWPNIYTINVPAGANGNNVNSGRLAARHASAAMGDAKLGTVSAEGDTAPSVPGYKFETPEAMADGVYTASAMGKDGDIDVTVTVEGNRIVAVEETNTYETPYIGNHAMDDIVIPAILEKGNLDITCDTFSGATLSCTPAPTAASRRPPPCSAGPLFGASPFKASSSEKEPLPARPRRGSSRATFRREVFERRWSDRAAAR